MSAQLENGYIRIANEIWDEIIRRDFSKRQKDILMFILRLSYGCNKKTAIIPKLKDFEVCGILSTHITLELKRLVECSVIEWNRDEGTYWFNKDYRFWQISPVKGWDSERYRQIVHLNLNEKSYQNSKLPKQELTKKVSENLPKSEVVEPANPRGSKAEAVSKDSIKDTQEEEEATAPKTAMDAYRFAFNKIQYTGYIQGYVVELLNRGLTDSFIREVFLYMGQRGVGPDERYMRKLAEDWIANGIYTRVEAERRRNAGKVVNHPVLTASEKEAQQQERLAKERQEAEPVGYEYYDQLFKEGVK